MAFSTPMNKFGHYVSSGAKALLYLPHTNRLPNKFNCYSSQKSNKIRANTSDVLTPINPQDDILRGCQKNCPESLWGQTFVPLAPLDSELEWHSKEVETLKVKVKDMLLHSTGELIENIHFINVLCRLGVSYHFENEINEQLGHIFAMLPKLLEDNDYDLCTLGTLFRVLRQHGHKMTCDVFKKFKDGATEFNEGITNDVKGILSLYEACFLAVPGEDILDKSLAFTRKHLKILAAKSKPHLQRHIENSLLCSSHGTFQRLDALQYISFYEEDEYTNETLLKFAKLDYNGLQLLYRKELSILSRWWETLNAMENFPYARDRIVEVHLWSVGTLFKPQYSLSRILMSKYSQVVTLMDDTYDSYGTIDELQLLTSALQRLTPEAVDELPKSMQPVYKAVFELVENDDTPQSCSCKTIFAREMIAEIAGGYMMEKIWQDEKKAPPYDEYMENGKITTALDIDAAGWFLGAKDMGMKEILWLRSDSQTLTASKLYLRFMNDIAENETNRGDFPEVLDCYMAQYGVSKDEATVAIRKTITNLWKMMNEDMMKPTTISRVLIMYAFNYARLAHIFCYHKDWFTYAHNTVPLATSLFVYPLPM
ncbi:Terpene synthase 5 [Euphorbia peplus]|nr:Terpene synthase 5 [Euphorbia peplus]